MEILFKEIKIKLVTKLLQSSNFYSSSSSRVSPSISSSATSLVPSPSSSSSWKDSVLWKSIKDMGDLRASVVPVLDQWRSEGNPVEKSLLRFLIRNLQRDKRFNHALEISYWMTNNLCCNLSRSDTAMRASLFQKTCGLGDVEAWFNNLPDHLRTYNDYATLFRYYALENCAKKAEAVMKEMREKEMEMSVFPYNLLIELYSKNGDFDKINILMQEMKRNGISPDKYTMRYRMESSIAASDTSGMEGILDQMKNDPQLVFDSKKYFFAAEGYLKAQRSEPALTLLRNAEQMLPVKRSKLDFQFLLTIYGKTGRIDELYRVWNAYKQLVGLNDKIFCCMMSSVLKLGDIEGAERIAEEWESQGTACSGLYKRIKIDKDLNSSVVPMLDQWICEGNTFEEPLLESLIWLLRGYRRYNNAIEISRWMRDCQYLTLPCGAAVQLRHIHRAHGLEHAEIYFNELSDMLRTYRVYDALLCCYMQESSVEKAEALMQEMREKRMLKSPYPYNLLTCLYSQNGEFNKINTLIREMERNEIHPDKFTMNYLMAGYVAAHNLSGMEITLNQINKNPQLVDGWLTYATAANGYLKFGLIEQTLTVLRKMEKLIPLRRSIMDFDCLLSLYAETGRKDELYRVWDAYKKLFYLNDKTFCCMMSSVLKLGDITGAERISEEWESQCTECSGLWKLIKITEDLNASVVPVLDEWIYEGNTVDESLFRSLIWLLRGYMRYNHANEITHWITDLQSFSLAPSGAALRLGIIHKTHGIEQAEKCFNKLSAELRTYHVYGALLCCYVKENSVQKAEAIMQEMREKGMAKTPYPYNWLTRLYTQNGEFEKMNILIQEMERNGISPKNYTTYGSASDISGKDKILNQINNNDPKLANKWSTYIMAANGYLESGLVEPALTMLRKMEDVIPLRNDKKAAFRCLLTLYAKTGRKDELYRVWNKYKQLIQLNSQIFRSMISLLAKLEDMEGAEKIFKEWESQCTKYEVGVGVRVLNKLLIPYCKKGLLEKAEAAVAKTAEQRTLCPSTWNVLARGYIKLNQMSKAVEMFKKAISVSSNGWKRNPIVLNACLDYLEAQGDVEGMQELIKSLKNLEPLTKDMYRRLVRTSVATGKVECLDRSLMNDFPADEEIDKILAEAKPSRWRKFWSFFSGKHV